LLKSFELALVRITANHPTNRGILKGKVVVKNGRKIGKGYGKRGLPEPQKIYTGCGDGGNGNREYVVVSAVESASGAKSRRLQAPGSGQSVYE
jgi:hypothetical protein